MPETVIFRKHNKFFPTGPPKNILYKGKPGDVFSKSSNTTQNQIKKLEKLADQSKEILLEIRTVFPFDFFPDTITIDRNKVNIISREFFKSAFINSIMIKNLKGAVAETSLFFATLMLIPDGYQQNPIKIKYLTRKDAFEARRIIQGLMVSHKENVDVSGVPPSDLKDKTSEIGKASPSEKEEVFQ